MVACISPVARAASSSSAGPEAPEEAAPDFADAVLLGGATRFVPAAERAVDGRVPASVLLGPSGLGICALAGALVCKEPRRCCSSWLPFVLAPSGADESYQ